MSLTSLPPSPRKVCLWYIFVALPVRNGPLPAELKFRENTASYSKNSSVNKVYVCMFVKVLRYC